MGWGRLKHSKVRDQRVQISNLTVFQSPPNRATRVNLEHKELDPLLCFAICGHGCDMQSFNVFWVTPCKNHEDP